jgi:hypothetical protein
VVYLDNARVESLNVAPPDFETREAAAKSYFTLFKKNEGRNAGGEGAFRR